jgi:hypothetical protein
VDATNTAMTAAQMVIAMPTTARVADGILQEAGWRDFTANAVSGGLPPMPPQQPMPQPEPAPQDAQPQAMPPEAMPPEAMPPEQPPAE